MHRRSAGRRRIGYIDDGVDADREASDALARLLADWCGFFDTCRSRACFRARRCRGEGVPCFEENAEGCYELLAELPVGQRLFEIAVTAAEEEDALA